MAGTPGLRRKEESFRRLCGTTSQALLAAARCQPWRSSHALTLVRVDAENRSYEKEPDVVRRTVWIPTLRKSGEGWGTHGMAS